MVRHSNRKLTKHERTFLSAVKNENLLQIDQRRKQFFK